MEMKNIPFGTTMKVTKLVLARAVYGWSAKKLRCDFLV